MSDNAIHINCNPYNEDIDNAEAILPAPPKTPEYRQSDEDMAEPNLESDEESPPASQLEQRHQAELAATATQRNERKILQGKARQKLPTYGKPQKGKERK